MSVWAADNKEKQAKREVAGFCAAAKKHFYFKKMYFSWSNFQF